MYDLTRFTEAQERSYHIALAEIMNGKKVSHWMWYIFPQLNGLGHSDTAKFYAIKDLAEAEAFLGDPYLGGNLINISEALLQHSDKTAADILGYPDDLKLRSSMTLFSMCCDAPPIFSEVLKLFFRDDKCAYTVKNLC